VILTWGQYAWGLCVSYNLKDNMTHPDNLALMKKNMFFFELVCANTKRNYAHLHDPDAFFARSEHSVEHCHVSVEFSTRPVPFKLILISCLLCLCLATVLPHVRFYAIGSYPLHVTFSTHLILLDFTTLIIFN
jgi:hypothetical protein